MQGEILPFLKAGFVFQDIALGEYPTSGKGLEKKWHRGSGTLRSSIAFDSRASGLSVSAGAAYRMDRERFILNCGGEYALTGAVSLAIGVSDSKFRCGLGCNVRGFELWYAFAVDSVNAGYDNTVSLAVML